MCRCICMDGCAHSGHVLRIRRPKTYAPPPGYDVRAQFLSGLTSGNIYIPTHMCLHGAD